jgi:Ser/Thr protein kinase RdoA (MazF antagonist)
VSERSSRDDRLAYAVASEWLGDPALRRLPNAMNSAAWEVETGGKRYVLKLSGRNNRPGLEVAACLERHGMRSGAPVRVAVRGGRLVALLRFVDGRPLSEEDVDLVGATLGRVHRLLAASPVPRGISRWPWRWLNPRAIEELPLRSAASAAINRAVQLAPAVTHGILHGDPAPEAFRKAGDDIGLIDWGAACHGPLLYDVASAWMYTDARVVASYARTGPLSAEELEYTKDFLVLRWAVQAWYFSTRRRSGDARGLTSASDNERGLADARAVLLGSLPEESTG